MVFGDHRRTFIPIDPDINFHHVANMALLGEKQFTHCRLSLLRRFAQQAKKLFDAVGEIVEVSERLLEEDHPPTVL
jgi:hypothetical protein